MHACMHTNGELYLFTHHPPRGGDGVVPAAALLPHCSAPLQHLPGEGSLAAAKHQPAAAGPEHLAKMMLMIQLAYRPLGVVGIIQLVHGPMGLMYNAENPQRHVLHENYMNNFMKKLEQHVEPLRRAARGPEVGRGLVARWQSRRCLSSEVGAEATSSPQTPVLYHGAAWWGCRTTLEAV